jgi:hypothetical protein
LLSRQNRRRLDWEALRDSLLTAAGKLDRSLGGPAVDILKPPYSGRRTIYGFIDRQNLPLTFRNFDFASPDTHAPARFVTSVPQQTLFLRNSPFVLELSRSLAKRQMSPTPSVADLFRQTYGRAPTAAETQLVEQFLSAASQDATVETPPLWQFGYGEYDDVAKVLKSFTPLPHWTGTQWQGGPALPDPKLGWVLWNANGGHPGDREHAAVLRWTAPRDVTVVITGTLKHGHPEGDGVLAAVISPSDGEKGRWIVSNQSVETFLPAIPLKQGESLDFVVASRSSVTHDSFQWAPKLTAVERGTTFTWDLARDFPKSSDGRTTSAPLTAWEQLSQTLLLSNEFQFVD